MGMEAVIIVDGVEMDNYNGRCSWSEVIDSKKKKYVRVSYDYEDGYGLHNLHIYIRDVLTGEVVETVHSQHEEDLVVPFPESCVGDVEVLVCMKGDHDNFYGYPHPYPLFITEPPKWCKEDHKSKTTRNNVIDALKNLKTYRDVTSLLMSFFKTVEGEYVFEGPTIDTSQLTAEEMKKVSELFKIWRQINGLPSWFSAFHVCYDSIERWMNVETE